MVSVLMPCYNGSATLAWAASSLVAQTYSRWECIFVDDCSSDGSMQLIERIGDPRFRCFRLAQRAGRGSARQIALDRAAGEYICLLDADDWIYPDKLESQVNWMSAQPLLGLISSGLAIVDGKCDIVGVRPAPGERGRIAVFEPRNTLRAPIFTSSIIRSEPARRVGFRAEYECGEDADFLERLCALCRYGIVADVTYVYTEYDTVTLPKLLRANQVFRKRLLARFSSDPLAIGLEVGKIFAKTAAYTAFFKSGQAHRLIARRSFTPDDDQVATFRRARETVARTYEQLFGQVMTAG